MVFTHYKGHQIMSDRYPKEFCEKRDGITITYEGFYVVIDGYTVADHNTDTQFFSSASEALAKAREIVDSRR